MKRIIFTNRWVLLVFIFVSCNIQSQIINENVLNKYVIKDTTGINDAVLVLYKDGSFINFGLVANKAKMDWYLWFTTGTYLNLPDKLFLKSGPETNDYEKIISSIKKYYTYRSDHLMIVTGYEHQRDNYLDYPIIIKGDNLYDEKRKFLYFEKK